MPTTPLPPLTVTMQPDQRTALATALQAMLRLAYARTSYLAPDHRHNDTLIRSFIKALETP